MRRTNSSTWTTVAVVALALTFMALAHHQWIWLSQVSHAERERLEASFRASGQNFVLDLDREITRAFFYFQLGPPIEDRAERRAILIEQLKRWQANAPYPSLVGGVWIASWRTPAEAQVERWDKASGTFEEVATETMPAAVRRVLVGTTRHLSSDNSSKNPPVGIEPTLPSLWVPLEPPFYFARKRADGSYLEIAIVVLDREALAREVLPKMAEKSFGLSQARHVVVAVHGATPSDLVWSSDPTLPADQLVDAEISFRLLRLGRFDDLNGLIPVPRGRTLGPPAGDAAGNHDRHEAHARERVILRRHLFPPNRSDGPWRLVVLHRGGTLDQVVERNRHRNFGISSAILAVLGGGVAALALSARRARRLADQQLELVAGVTHELNTPLAAIRSAGQNLADGVIVDPEKVRRYGSLIQREGERLSGLVASALELAGIESGARPFAIEPLAIGEIVDAALADLDLVDLNLSLDGDGITIERDLPSDLPRALADREALRLALRNLFDNARKHAAEGGYLGIAARLETGGRGGRTGPRMGSSTGLRTESSVAITVSDRGAGIPAADRERIFEPFVRAEKTASGKVPGSGLGLALARRTIEAQGGTLTLEAPPPGTSGARFVVRLPAEGA